MDDWAACVARGEAEDVFSDPGCPVEEGGSFWVCVFVSSLILNEFRVDGEREGWANWMRRIIFDVSGSCELWER